ncbi:pilus assembly protein PilV [Aquabacterium sp. CECT 9606]|uniref:type IV pilus modification PilV family protein n=1 Tax=Aquabacterium sp. CECT 9606 TaxID=2845822 RepID=UPI001E42814D|nr:pilus assembly protein PilV [Aquabacterium sp. CECT 9606]CAH0354188.1 hypothetical protein AQB9606_03576 [Aquabacterium sp. CECT 9606]
MRSQPLPQKHSARGFMLIEVLVSVLLFSVGVLALVGLQANMNQAQGASKVRTDAAYLANELTGLMWSDADHLGDYTDTACGAYKRCQAWKDKVAASLPGGAANVTVNTDREVTIQINWTPPDGTAHKYVSETTIQG